MCGIVGVFQYRSPIPRDIRAKALRILFSDSMYYTQIRGSDATGVYQVHTDGDWMYAKEGEKVSKWLFQDSNERTPAIYRDFLDSWTQHPHELTAVVGHCRKATIGSHGGSNADNHPFAIQVDARNAILGCHNGTLTNHETIFRRLPEGLERQGKTDSEVIFHFMWHLTEQGQVPFSGEMIRTLGRRLDGAFACIAVNSKFPNIVATFRDGRPMDYVLVSPLNVVIAASEKKFVMEALENYERIQAFYDPSLPKLYYDDRSLSDRDWRIFDTELEFPICTGKPSFQAIQEISLGTGTIRNYGHSVEDEWKAPKTDTTSSATSGYPKHQPASGGYSGGYGGRQTRSGATSATTPIKPTIYKKPAAQISKPTKKAKRAEATDDVVTTGAVVVVPTNEEEELARAFEEVRSLGICPAFSDEVSVANALGRTSLDNMSVPAIATALSRTVFSLGYAVSRADQRQEALNIRRQGRELAPKLEAAIGKRLRAQQHIWTHKQLVILLLSMVRANYKLSEENVIRALQLFPGMGEDNQETVASAFSAILEDKGAQRLLRGLEENYARAEARRKRNAQVRASQAASKAREEGQASE